MSLWTQIKAVRLSTLMSEEEIAHLRGLLFQLEKELYPVVGILYLSSHPHPRDAYIKLVEIFGDLHAE